MRGGRTLAFTASVAAVLARRYAEGRRREDRQTTAELDSRLTDLGEVDRLSVLPLVERHPASEALRGEAGVSYLIRADELTLLFDSGLGLGRRRTALETNAEKLGVRFDDLDCLVISHLHADHVGGGVSQIRHTFSFGSEQPVPRSLPSYVPTEMSHARADISVVQEARVIGPGVAVLPPLPRMLFWSGPIAEQAIVINVRGRGLVLVTGCGHPEIERTLAAAERVVDVPVYAVIGGLHLPVHAWGTPLVPQAVLGSPNWPWRPISEGDARAVIEAIRERGPGLVALSGHDSTQWTLDAFAQTFGGNYRTLRVGEELVIDATDWRG
jgi:7,8-dihydropterin-6-yl-methyl-4-(beta-D-ribofuranosyl)aminobenzene 5'-phosphate synthase